MQFRNLVIEDATLLTDRYQVLHFDSNKECLYVVRSIYTALNTTGYRRTGLNLIGDGYIRKYYITAKGVTPKEWQS